MKNVQRVLVSLAVLSGLVFSGSALAGSGPKMSTLSKYKGQVGERITIKGKNFGKKNGEVIFDHAASVEIKSWRKNRVEFYIPNLDPQNSYRVRVCQRDGDCSKYQKFYVTRTGPEIDVLSKYSGVPGDKVKIKGLNFSSRSTNVLFGSNEVTPSKRTSKVIYFVIPNVSRGATYSVKVTDGTNTSNGQDFWVTP
jgi:hypothetical protein